MATNMQKNMNMSILILKRDQLSSWTFWTYNLALYGRITLVEINLLPTDAVRQSLLIAHPIDISFPLSQRTSAFYFQILGGNVLMEYGSLDQEYQ